MPIGFGSGQLLSEVLGTHYPPDPIIFFPPGPIVPPNPIFPLFTETIVDGDNTIILVGAAYDEFSAHVDPDQQPPAVVLSDTLIG